MGNFIALAPSKWKQGRQHLRVFPALLPGAYSSFPIDKPPGWRGGESRGLLSSIGFS